MNDQNNNQSQTADNADAAATNASASAEAGNTNTNTKKKSKLRRFGGYALKGAIATAVVGGVYFGVRALMGNAAGEAIDAVASAA